MDIIKSIFPKISKIHFSFEIIIKYLDAKIIIGSPTCIIPLIATLRRTADIAYHPTKPPNPTRMTSIMLREEPLG